MTVWNLTKNVTYIHSARLKHGIYFKFEKLGYIEQQGYFEEKGYFEGFSCWKKWALICILIRSR